MREALIQGESQIAITEEGKLVNYYRASSECSYGDIFYGRIVKCVSGDSPACFVDIGLPENAFCPDRGKMKQGDFGPFMVEAAAHDNKTVRVSCKIKISGKYVVSLYQKGVVKLSSKITDNETKKRLKAVGEAILKRFPCIQGVLMRTEAAAAAEKQLFETAEQLNSLLAAVMKGKDSPGLMYRPDFVLSVLGKYSEYDSIITDSTEVLERIKLFYPKVRFRASVDFLLFDVKDVSSQLVSLMGRRVWLPSGGNIVIEKTEAMTVIDVNSAKATGNKADFLAVNREAVREIMRQLRLRNMGGIIICDFIGMDEEGCREIFENARILAEKDPGKPVIHGFTALGLMEISRKRT